MGKLWTDLRLESQPWNGTSTEYGAKIGKGTAETPVKIKHSSR